MQENTAVRPVAENDHTLVHRAIQFATEAHAGQIRKISHIPYIWHPLAVGRSLTDLKCSPEVVAAGILHDVVEDTPRTLEDVENAFGKEVAQLVDLCSEPTDGRRWEDRKAYLIGRIRFAPLGARLIVAIDKLDNLESVKEGLETFGPSMWNRFSRGQEQQEWYYRSMAASLRGRNFDLDPLESDLPLSPEYDHPVFDELDGAIAEMFGEN